MLVENHFATAPKQAKEVAQAAKRKGLGPSAFRN